MSLKDLNPVNASAPKRVAIVISNPAVSETTGWPIGFWWSELTHPWYAFTEKGYAVTIFSPDGGACTADSFSDPRDASGYSSTDLISMGFIATPSLAALIDDTLAIATLDVNAFDAILRHARLSTGDLLAKGRTVTGFANVEEDFADNAVWSAGYLSRDTHVQPWRIEDEMRRIGANYVQAGLWRGFAIRDRNLITGQQNFSGGETAELVIAALGE